MVMRRRETNVVKKNGNSWTLAGSMINNQDANIKLSVRRREFMSEWNFPVRILIVGEQGLVSQEFVAILTLVFYLMFKQKKFHVFQWSNIFEALKMT